MNHKYKCIEALLSYINMSIDYSYKPNALNGL